jgi:hypothetical protein
MNTIGVLLLAAATAGDGFGYSKPDVGLKRLLRPHAVVHGAPPPGGMIDPGAAGGGPGAGGPNGNRRFPNTKSQVFFLDPNGMHIGWQTSGGASGSERIYLPCQLTVPARYNFQQGYIYRLKLTDIPGRSTATLYPTIEVAPSTPATDAYLTHNPIPVQFTPEDFDQVLDGGNFVTKVIYLPDPKYQELAVAGVETLVSTRLEPGVDPILEADKRGTILMIVRLGAIDLEMQPGGAYTVPAAAPASTVVPPASLAPGALNGPTTESVPVDTAPVNVAPTPAPAAAPMPPVPAPVTPPPVPPAVVPPPAEPPPADSPK